MELVREIGSGGYSRDRNAIWLDMISLGRLRRQKRKGWMQPQSPHPLLLGHISFVRAPLAANAAGAQAYPDDHTVIWRDLPIGRIMLAPGLPPHVLCTSLMMPHEPPICAMLRLPSDSTASHARNIIPVHRKSTNFASLRLSRRSHSATLPPTTTPHFPLPHECPNRDAQSRSARHHHSDSAPAQSWIGRRLFCQCLKDTRAAFLLAS